MNTLCYIAIDCILDYMIVDVDELKDMYYKYRNNNILRYRKSINIRIDINNMNGMELRWYYYICINDNSINVIPDRLIVINNLYIFGNTSISVLPNRLNCNKVYIRGNSTISNVSDEIDTDLKNMICNIPDIFICNGIYRNAINSIPDYLNI
jgi:hypothetical protein